jgi:hypothetical protein
MWLEPRDKELGRSGRMVTAGRSLTLRERRSSSRSGATVGVHSHPLVGTGDSTGERRSA